MPSDESGPIVATIRPCVLAPATWLRPGDRSGHKPRSKYGGWQAASGAGVSASAVMATTANGRNPWALRFMCAPRAAQGASHFLPIFYRPAETGYERTRAKLG